jgi:hypothetical protein
MRRLKFTVVFSAIAGLFLSSVAQAQSAGPLDYRFGLTGGAFFAEVDTSMRWDSNLIPGTEIGLESQLGMDNNETAFAGQLEWRFFRRHSLSVSHFKLNRDGAADAPFNLIVGGETIPIGDRVTSSFGAKVTAFHYEFSFINRDNLRMDLGLGLSVQDLNFSINGESSNIDENGDVTAPLPTVTLGLDWAITPKWIVNLDVGWFDLKIDNVKGEITELTGGITWMPWNQVGFNLAYNYFKVKGTVTSEEGNFRGQVGYEFTGPLLGVVATF